MERLTLSVPSRHTWTVKEYNQKILYTIVVPNTKIPTLIIEMQTKGMTNLSDFKHSKVKIECKILCFISKIQHKVKYYINRILKISFKKTNNLLLIKKLFKL